MENASATRSKRSSGNGNGDVMVEQSNAMKIPDSRGQCAGGRNRDNSDGDMNG